MRRGMGICSEDGQRGGVWAWCRNFARESEQATPALVKRTPEPFNIPAATTPTGTVHGDALPATPLTKNATAKASDVVADLMQGFTNANGLVTADAENDRGVIATVNKGTSDTALQTPVLPLPAL